MGIGLARPCRGFTILELSVAIAIIAILVVLVLGGAAMLRSRAHRLQCMENLKSLYTGVERYRQENDHWPQVGVDPASETGMEQFAAAWVTVLQPFGADAKTWICPEIQQLLGNPDYLRPENARIDYIPMSFDNKPLTPHQWPTQPWFIERGDAHGSGNLIIFTDGHIAAANEIVGQ